MRRVSATLTFPLNLLVQGTSSTASTRNFRLFGPLKVKVKMERTLRMKELLERELTTTYLELINESHLHNVPKESETHFKIVVVTPQFEGVSRVKREQKIQGLLKEEMELGLHALSIVAKTPEEWTKLTGGVTPSPNCMGGFGK